MFDEAERFSRRTISVCLSGGGEDGDEDGLPSVIEDTTLGPGKKSDADMLTRCYHLRYLLYFLNYCADESDEDVGGGNHDAIVPVPTMEADKNEDRDGEHTISNFETIIHVLKGNIGIGVLTLPMAIK